MKYNSAMLKYRIGSALEPQAGGHKLVIHVVNDLGMWGKGFVTAISKHWQKPEESCLKKVAKEAKNFGSSVHCPRFGAGLAAGCASGYCPITWTKIEQLIKDNLVSNGINVTVYDLK